MPKNNDVKLLINLYLTNRRKEIRTKVCYQKKILTLFCRHKPLREYTSHTLGH